MDHKYTFYLDDLQEQEFDEWSTKIIDLHGDEGSFKFIFIPGAIGCSIFVENSHVEKPLDLSHAERW